MAFEKYLIRDNGLPSVSNALLESCIIYRLDENMPSSAVISQIEEFLTKKNKGNSISLTSQEEGDINNLINWVRAEIGERQLKAIMKIWALINFIEEGSTVHDTEQEIRAGIYDITDNLVVWTADI